MLTDQRKLIIDKLKELKEDGLVTVESFANQLKDENAVKFFVKRMPAVLVSLPVVRCTPSSDYGLFSVNLDYEVYLFLNSLQSQEIGIEKVEDLIILVAEKLIELDRFTLQEFVPIHQEYPLTIYCGRITTKTSKELGE